MPNYEIWKIRQGVIYNRAAINWMGMMPVLPLDDTPVMASACCWYIEGPGIRMMYDAGQASASIVTRQLSKGRSSTPSGLPEAIGGGPEPIRFALEEQLKVNVDEINYVVPSHMHTGWFQNVDLFPKAQLIVQREEILAIWDPDAPHRMAVSRETLMKVLTRKEPDHLLIIDGDYKIAPGLEIIFTGGHSYGHQALLVQTSKGKAGMLGELGISYAHIYPGDPRIHSKGTDIPLPFGFAKGTHLPLGLLDDPQGEVKAVDRMLALADIVVPADLSSPKMIPEQWWDVPSEEYWRYSQEAYKEYKPGIYPDVLHLLKGRRRSRSAAQGGKQ